LACSSKELWNLVNDSDAIKAEREKAAKNRHKYGGIDNHGFAATSYPAANVYRPHATVAAAADGDDGVEEDDAVEATEKRIEELSLGESEGNGGVGARRSSAVGTTAKPKPKLSAIAVRFDIS
jgi:hypothetical protein